MLNSVTFFLIALGGAAVTAGLSAAVNLVIGKVMDLAGHRDQACVTVLSHTKAA